MGEDFLKSLFMSHTMEKNKASRKMINLINLATHNNERENKNYNDATQAHKTIKKRFLAEYKHPNDEKKQDLNNFYFHMKFDMVFDNVY